MNHKAFKELYNILKIEGLSRKDGLEARQEALDRWLNSWVEEISISQPIIKKNLTKEDKALITEHVLEQVLETLMDDCIYLEQTPKKIEVKLYGIRR